MNSKQLLMVVVIGVVIGIAAMMMMREQPSQVVEEKPAVPVQAVTPAQQQELDQRRKELLLKRQEQMQQLQVQDQENQGGFRRLEAVESGSGVETIYLPGSSEEDVLKNLSPEDQQRYMEMMQHQRPQPAQ